MKTEWINVKTKLPRQGKEVLIFWINHQKEKFTVIGTCWKGEQGRQWHFNYNDVDGTNMLDDSQVTHWMPLSEPPKLKTK